jgi:valyl-tRNA synthetase
MATVEAKLQNEAFMQKAPQNVIDGVRANGEKLSEKIRMIQSEIEALG